MPMKYDSATPHIASYVVAIKDTKVAFVLRSNTPWMNGYYSLPAGKVETGESFTECAVREAKEEIGITIQQKNLKHIHTSHRYEPSKQAEDWLDVFFEGTKWKGEAYNAEPTVHGELAWLDLKNLPENIVPNVRFALEQMEQGKIYSEYGWN